MQMFVSLLICFKGLYLACYGTWQNPAPGSMRTEYALTNLSYKMMSGISKVAFQRFLKQ